MTSPPHSIYMYEDVADLAASSEDVFAFLDNHDRLSGHMAQPSWMLGGGSFSVHWDTARGKAVGSRITLRGRAFGVSMSVVEEVYEYAPPWFKSWRTVGMPQLLILSHYRMGFRLAPHDAVVQLRIAIEYDLPAKALLRWVSRPLARLYAKWCVQQMLSEARSHFSPAS